MDFLSTALPLVTALSVATERLVEIIKQVVPFLNQPNTDAVKEGWRHATLQALAVVAGIVTVTLVKWANAAAIPDAWQSPSGLIALGLLASGGSGFWNSISTFVLKLKDLKQLDVTQKSQTIAGIARAGGPVVSSQAALKGLKP
jgi:hypothetical protein